MEENDLEKQEQALIDEEREEQLEVEDRERNKGIPEGSVSCFSSGSTQKKYNNENRITLRLTENDFKILRYVNNYYVNDLGQNISFSEVLRKGFRLYWRFKIDKWKDKKMREKLKEQKGNETDNK